MTEFERALDSTNSASWPSNTRRSRKQLSVQVESLGKQVRQLAGQYGQEQTRLAGQVANLAGQVESLEEQVRRLAEQYAQDQKTHIELASTLVEQQQQLGAHVTTLTDAYDSLLENVNRMIDASNSVTRELERTFVDDPLQRLSRSGRMGTGQTAWRVSLRAVSKTEYAATAMTSTCSSHSSRQPRLLLHASTSA